MGRSGGYIGARPSWNNVTNRNGSWRLNEIYEAIVSGTGWWATTFMYSNTSTTLTLGPGSYTIKMWGAGGGGSSGGGNGYTPGAGGGALVKSVVLTGTETWNIYSGGGGNTAIGSADDRTSIQYGVGPAGDYPGGSGAGFYGSGYEQGIWCGGAGGGAAVLVGTTPGTLVAGGGGGAGGDGSTAGKPTGGGTGNGAGGSAGSGGGAGSSGYYGYGGGGGGSNRAAQNQGSGGQGGQNIGSGATLYNGSTNGLVGNSNDPQYIYGYGIGAQISGGQVQTRGGHSLIIITKIQ